MHSKPDPDDYTIIMCTECGTLKIVEGAPQTTECFGCDKRLKLKKVKNIFQTKNKDAATRVLGQERARRSGDDSFEEWKTAVDAGELDEDETDGPPELEEAVREAIRTLDEPTTPGVADWVEETYGYTDEGDVEELIERWHETASVLKQSDGTLRLV